ncbi:UNVERIFIED_CONTAM: hypothetical protein H355_014731 [Colinus virginianus]|nr:hypothetical protein H355_014731 [Colinus virginianus]
MPNVPVLSVTFSHSRREANTPQPPRGYDCHVAISTDPVELWPCHSASNVSIAAWLSPDYCRKVICPGSQKDDGWVMQEDGKSEHRAASTASRSLLPFQKNLLSPPW